MATTTPNLGLTKPDPGGDDDAWAPMLNGNADILDGAVQDALDAAAAANANANTRLPATALPIGISLEWNGSSLPAGFLWENGANVSRSTYAALFSAIGTVFGAGDGSTTFGLPDSRGRIAVGRDDMGGTAAGRITSGVSGLAGATLGAAGGDQRQQAHTHTTDSQGLHGHGMVYSFADGGDLLGLQIGGAQGSDGPGNTRITANGAHTHTALTAGAGASQNVQPSIVKNKIIYAGV